MTQVGRSAIFLVIIFALLQWTFAIVQPGDPGYHEKTAASHQQPVNEIHLAYDRDQYLGEGNAQRLAEEAKKGGAGGQATEGDKPEIGGATTEKEVAKEGTTTTKVTAKGGSWKVQVGTGVVCVASLALFF